MGMGVFVLGPLAQALIDTVGWRGATAILGVSIMMVVFPIAWWGCRDPKNPRPKIAHDAASSRSRAGDREGEEGRGGERSSDHDLGSPGYAVRSSQPSPLSRTDPGRERVTRTSPHPAPPPPRGVTLADALRTRAFWALFAAYFMTPLAVFPIVTHQVAFAVDLGFPRLLVASIFGVLGLMSVAGRVLFGLLADRAGGAQAATLSYACTAAGAVALIAAESWPHTGWLIVYALLFGLGFGARGPIITAIASDLFGGARFGVIWGALNLSNGVGGAIGPWYGGLVHDVMGSYRLVFLSSIVFSALGSLCFWLARRRAP
jgi:predicted MFS family arabinose efflux permease